MEANIQFPCPECGQLHQVDSSQFGRTARCRRCGKEFIVSAAGATSMGGNWTSVAARAVPPGVGVKSEAVPASLGRFQVRGLVGRGGFGAVLRAYDPVLDREVALKIPQASVLGDPGIKARFVREAKAAAHLRHPNIVPLYDAGAHGEQFYLAYAFIQGETLARVIERGRPDFRRSAEIVRRLAEALDYAHKMGVTHRDVKPANILVDERGQVLLTDFGLARLASTQEKLTQDGTVMGTPAYIAPEQAHAPWGEVGAASDQYSLGIVLYELLCGKTPFAGPPAVLLYNAIHTAPAPPRDKVPEVPRDLETICLKTIAKRPEERYGDCGELAQELRRWLDDEPIRARRLGLVERAVRVARQNPTVAALAGVILLLTTVGLAATTTLWQWRQAAYRQLLQTNREVEVLAESREQERKRAEDGERAAKGSQAQAEQSARGMKEALAEASANEAKALKAEQEAVVEKKKADEANRMLTQSVRDLREQQARLAAAYESLQQQVSLQRRQYYLRSIIEAQQAIEEHDFERGEECLEQSPPELRHWEWRYLKRRCFQPDPCHSYFGQGKPVSAVALSPDDQWIASGGTDGVVKVWSTGTSRALSASSRHKGAITALAFDQGQGRWLASAANDKAVYFWDLVQGSPPRQRTSVSRSSAIACLASSPDGLFLAAGGADRAVCVVRIESLQEAIRLPTPEGQTACLAFSRDGKSLAGGTTGGMLRCWDLAAGRERWAVEAHDEAITAVCYSVDGQRIATGSADKTLRVWDSAAGKPRCTCHGHTGTVRGAAFSVDGKRLISGGRDATLRIWDADSGQPILTLPGRTHDVTPGKNKEITGLAISRDGYRVITGNGDETVKLWSAAYDPEVLRFRAHENSVHGIAYSPDGTRLASCSADGTVKLWDAAGGANLATLAGHTSAVYQVAFSPDGARIASASGDATVRLWDAQSHSSLQEFSAGRGAALCVAFDREPKRPRMAWAGADGIVRFCSLGTREEVREFRRHDGNVYALAFSPQGAQLVSAGLDRKIRFWNIASGQMVDVVPALDGVGAHDDAIVVLSFSPDGATLFSGARDGSLRLWTLGKRWMAPPSPPFGRKNVRSIAVHPQGKWVALAWNRMVVNLDGTTALVAPADRGHAAKVLAVAYRPDGRRLASADELGYVKIWDVSRDRPAMTAEAAAPDEASPATPRERR
jgi:WD40 repeat protein/predicted RNA-binding Zn-ribbon protein involved in translation (DUF1610 family)